MAASTPSPPVKSLQNEIISVSELFTVISAPIFSASFRRSGRISQAMTFSAPKVLAPAITVSPIAPHPLTSTFFPSTSAFSTPRIPDPIGSKRQPTSSEISSVSLYVIFSGAATYSANAPSLPTPNRDIFIHMLDLPLKHIGHFPQGICDSKATLSPGFLSVTFLPASTTSPHASCPIITGGFTQIRDHLSQSIMWISVPHKAALFTFTRTSSSFGSGMGRSSCQTGAHVPFCSFFRPNIVSDIIMPLSHLFLPYAIKLAGNGNIRSATAIIIGTAGISCISIAL